MAKVIFTAMVEVTEYAMVMAKVTASVKAMAAIKGDSVRDGQWQQVMATTMATATGGTEAT